jgi:hypothetical protein
MSERSGISDKEETPRGPADGAGSQLELPFGVSLAGLTASGSSSHLLVRFRSCRSLLQTRCILAGSTYR